MQDIFPEDAPVVRPAGYDAALNGLGGWFSLIIIGLILGVARDIYYMITVLQHPDLSGSFLYLALIIESAVDIAWVGTILFFILKRNIIFRKLFVLRFAVILLVNIILAACIDSRFYDLSDWTDFGISLAATMGWIYYLYSAKRVKNTFIYPKVDFSRNNSFIEY